MRFGLLACSALLFLGLACSDNGNGTPQDSGEDARDAQDASNGGDMAGDAQEDGTAGDDAGDLVADADHKYIDWASLNGTVPPQPLPAPDFNARNRDDTLRTRQDLIGHPTVIWFHPSAATPG